MMFNPHTLTHLGLAVVHAMLSVILLLEASFAHAACVASAAALYGVLCWPPRGPGAGE